MYFVIKRAKVKKHIPEEPLKDIISPKEIAGFLTILVGLSALSIFTRKAISKFFTSKTNAGNVSKTITQKKAPSTRDQGTSTDDLPSNDIPKPNPPENKAQRTKKDWINEVDHEGNTHLHNAISAEDAELVKYLIREGSKLNRENQARQTPLDIAIIKDNFEIITLLKKALIFQAIEQGNTPKVERLINGIDFNKMQNDEGQTLLHLSIIEERQEIIKLLLNSGADLKTKNKLGHTALHTAVLKGDIRLIEMVLKGNKDYEKIKVDEMDESGKTALFYAPKFPNTIRELLKEYGAEIEKRDFTSDHQLNVEDDEKMRNKNSVSDSPLPNPDLNQSDNKNC